jgi:hypothetical protein
MSAIFQQPKNTLPSIEEVFMFVSVDAEDGNEGVIGAPMDPMNCVPLIAADKKRLESLTPIAEKLAKFGNVKIRLIRLSHREVIREINP